MMKQLRAPLYAAMLTCVTIAHSSAAQSPQIDTANTDLPPALYAEQYGYAPKNGDLKHIIISAYKYHPALKSLDSQAKGTRENLIEARANYFPQLELSGGIYRSRREAELQVGSPFDQNTTPKSVTLSLSQTLYNGGRRSLATRNAVYSVTAADARYANAATSIAAEIIEDYMSLLAALAEVNVLTESVGTLEKLETAMLARRALGDVTRTDVAQTRSRLASARARRIAAQASLNNARSQLYSKTGFLIENPKLPTEATSEITSSLEEIKTLSREISPAIQGSEMAMMTAKVDMLSETRKHLPTISLSANASSDRDTSPTISKDEDLNIGLTFSMPIYTAGIGASQTRRSSAVYNAARFDHENIIRQNDLQMAQFWTEIQSSRYVIDAQRSSVAASAEALTGVTRSEAVGIASSQDILDAAQNKLEADITLLRAQYQQYTTRLLLKLYIGKFDVYKFD